MKMIIPWTYDGHRLAFQQALLAVSKTHAVNPNSKINPEYGAALYLLTGLEYAWPGLSQYVSTDGICYKQMINNVAMSLSEKLIVGLSGNLFNGDTYINDLTPLNLIGCLDNDAWDMVLTAFELRRGSIRLTLYDVADD